MLHECGEVMSVTAGVDWLVDGNPDMSGAGEKLESRQYVESTVDGDRHHGEIKLHGQFVGTLFETPHITIPRAGSFGEDRERHASAQLLLGLLHGASSRANRRIVDKYLSGGFACPADKGNLAQTLLHHPAEIVAEISEKREYVICALMVGDKYIRCVLVDVAAAFHFD